MRFSQDFIDKVRDASSIVEIIGSYTELKGSGHRLTGRCPFPDHSDKSPSFSVTEDNQLFYCYGCKKGGNIYNFLQTFNGMSFPESVEYLARRASIPMPEPEDKTQVRQAAASRDQKEILYKINKTAAVFYHQQLKAEAEDSPVRVYLQKRGLSEEIVDKFRLGVSFEEWQSLYQHLRSKSIPIDQAEVLGLVKPKKGARPDDTHFDLFRDRLMFPIFSPTSEVVGFGGRTLGDGLPKYVNSSDSPLFHKGKILYGLHETGKFIRAQDEAIVVEGYMDAISLYSAGIKNVVAILGTAFTADHAKILKRYTVNVKMLLDGDDAGIAGAERSLPILLEAGLMAKGFLLPEKMDPDDFVKANGPDQLRSEVERAPELFTLLMNHLWMQNYHGSPSEKVQIVDQAAQVLKGMQNRQLLELYLLEMTRVLDVEINWLRAALNQSVLARQPRTQTSVVPGASGPTPHQPVLGPFGQPVQPSRSPITPVGAAKITPRGVQRQELVPPAEEAKPSGADETVSDDPAALVPEVISVKGAPRDEAFVLSLLLHNENLMRELVEAGPEGLLEILSHSGIRRVLTLAAEKYRQSPGSFATLAASLASQIDMPSIITSSLDIPREHSKEHAKTPALPEPNRSEDNDDERRLMSDYLNAIRKRFLKNQGQALASQLRDQASPEKLEQFMNIQRNRLSLTRDN
jgi:DNA primase